MRDFRDAKAMAQTLREALKSKSVDLSHSESLELTARMLGLRNWNVLAARIEAESGAGASPPAAAPQVGTPVIPIRDLVLFPEMTAPLFIGRPKSVRAVERAMAGERRVLLLAQKRAADDDPGPEELYGVGVVGQILDVMTLPDGSLKVMVRGVARAKVTRMVRGELLQAEFEPASAFAAQSLTDAQMAILSRMKAPDPEAETLVKEALDRFQQHANVDLSAPPQAMVMLTHVKHPGLLADLLVNHLSLSQDQRQALLETEDPVERLRELMAMMQGAKRAA